MSARKAVRWLIVSLFAAAFAGSPCLVCAAIQPLPTAETRAALSLSMGHRLEALHSQGPEGYRNLVRIMFDAKSPMALRWKATTAVGRLGGPASMPELGRAFKRKEWFMRSAALMAVRQLDRAKARNWARALLADKALVVRSAAVDALAEVGDFSDAATLWSKLYAGENYAGGESLWIRRRILETLAKIESPGAEKRFLKTLSDRDVSLYPVAIAALERLSGDRLGAPGASVQAKRELWLQRAKTFKQLS